MSMTIEEIIGQLDSLQDSSASFASEKDAEPIWQMDVCAIEDTVLILRELQKEGIDDLESVRDLIADYNAQAKTYQAMHQKYEVASKPVRKDGVLHCPECNHRVSPHHSHCHWCGKKLGY